MYFKPTGKGRAPCPAGPKGAAAGCSQNNTPGRWAEAEQKQNIFRQKQHRRGRFAFAPGTSGPAGTGPRPASRPPPLGPGPGPGPLLGPKPRPDPALPLPHRKPQGPAEAPSRLTSPVPTPPPRGPGEPPGQPPSAAGPGPAWRGKRRPAAGH